MREVVRKGGAMSESIGTEALTRWANQRPGCLSEATPEQAQLFAQAAVDARRERDDAIREKDVYFDAFTERCNAYHKLDMEYKILTDLLMKSEDSEVELASQLTAVNKALVWCWEHHERSGH